VHSTLEKRREDTSVIFLAHRLSSVLRADRVAVIVDGRVEELGTPQELAKAGGWFQENFYPAEPSEG